MRKRLTVLGLALVIGAFVRTVATPLDRDLIPDSATAIKVGGAILETWMGKKQFAAMVKRAPLRADLEGDVWSVYAYPNVAGQLQHDSNGGTTITVTTGGGHPVIEFSRRNAQVKDIYFAR